MCVCVCVCVCVCLCVRVCERAVRSQCDCAVPVVAVYLLSCPPPPPPPLLLQRKVCSEYSSLSKGESEDVSLVGQVVEDLIKMEGTIFKVRGEE